MAEVMRYLAGRLREWFGNRRQESRRPQRLVCQVAVCAPRSVKGLACPTPLKGHTRDVSPTGLALVVPTIRIGERYLTGDNRALHVTLELPSGAVRLVAAPVRYEKLDEDETEQGYVIGLQITEMSDEDRARWLEYLSS